MGLRLCAIDIVSGSQLAPQVLEVNDAFSVEHYASVSEINKKRAEGVYDAILSKIFD